MSVYKKYKIRNTTKSQNEYIWMEESAAVPVSSVENPSDNIDTAQTAIIERRESSFDPALPDLQSMKDKRHQEVRDKTDTILESGSFLYGGKEFKLTDTALVRWVGVGYADSKNWISFPFTVTAKDFSTYDIVSKTDWDGFFSTGLGTMTAIEDAGRALHTAIVDAVDQAALDAVVDSR